MGDYEYVGLKHVDSDYARGVEYILHKPRTDIKRFHSEYSNQFDLHIRLQCSVGRNYVSQLLLTKAGGCWFEASRRCVDVSCIFLLVYHYFISSSSTFEDHIRRELVQAIMPDQKPVIVRESSSLEVSGGQTEGMERANALVGLTPNICASRMIAKPHTASAVHHHGAQDTVVFSFSGYGTVVSEGGNKRQHLNPGDYALIP